MSAKHEHAVLGVGVAACAVCCAGPVVGLLAAIGIGTAAGFALFGAIAIVLGAPATAFVLRRRRRAVACAPALPSTVSVGRRR